MLESKGCKNGRTLDRPQAILAALPLLLFGLCVAAITLFLVAIGGPSHILRLARGPVWHNGALVVGLIALAALIGAALVALAGRLPVWGYTWIGAGLTGLLIALNLVVEDRAFVLSPLIDVTLLVFLALSALITFGTAALRGWQHSGLYTVGLGATLGLSLCFFGVAGPFHAYLGGLAALLAAIEAALVYAYLRGSNAARAACLICVGAANIGIAWIVEWIFRSAHPAREIEQFWVLAAMLTALLVGGTLAGVLGAIIRRRLR
jgi:hypothetical protein